MVEKASGVLYWVHMVHKLMHASKGESKFFHVSLPITLLLKISAADNEGSEKSPDEN